MKENAEIIKNKSDFSQGSVYRHIISLAVPLTAAQLVQMLYNVVDRIYIGHLPENAAAALGGVGLAFPIVTVILAFTNLFGMGGAPLFSIERGRRNDDRAEMIMCNTFSMLMISSAVLMLLCYVFLKPVLYIFGASAGNYEYAASYMTIYLIGTPFTMLATGMNGFINAQGFARTGMMTVLLGACANILLDPLFIFALGMGVRGAAAATVISQILSAAWVLAFFRGKNTLFRLRRKYMRPEPATVKNIMSLGAAGFVMSASNGVVQIACNATLQSTGGDMYVSVMTVLTSLREIMIMPVQGLTSASQPVLGYNYGAKCYDRVRTAIRFITVVSFVMMTAAWLLLREFPELVMRLFTSDAELIAEGVPALHIYFWGLFMMAFHCAGQSTFVGLGMSKHAVFFSMLRKVIIVVPLTLVLPHVAGLGVNGVFIAEPVSNFASGVLCYVTMLVSIRHVFAGDHDK